MFWALKALYKRYVYSSSSWWEQLQIGSSRCWWTWIRKAVFSLCLSSPSGLPGSMRISTWVSSPFLLALGYRWRGCKLWWAVEETNFFSFFVLLLKFSLSFVVFDPLPPPPLHPPGYNSLRCCPQFKISVQKTRSRLVGRRAASLQTRQHACAAWQWSQDSTQVRLLPHAHNTCPAISHLRTLCIQHSVASSSQLAASGRRTSTAATCPRFLSPPLVVQRLTATIQRGSILLCRLVVIGRYILGRWS